MKEPLRTTIDHYILPNKILCSMAGIWPIDKKSTTGWKAFAYFRVLLALTAVNSLFIPEILAIVMHWGDLKVLTGVGCVSNAVGQLSFKMLYILVRRERISGLYNEIRNLWNSSNDPRQIVSYERFASWARAFTIIFFSLGMFNLVAFTIAAIVSNSSIKRNASTEEVVSLGFPFEVWYGVDITESPTFEIAFVFQVIAAFISVAGIAGLDATFMTIILHVCGQFKLIQQWFVNIAITINRDTMYEDISRKLKRDIQKCVKHHQRIIRVVKEVNNLLSPIAFVQLLMSGLEICLSGYSVINDVTGVDLLKFTSYLFSMLIQLLLWCWPAEILIHESQQVGNVVYFDVPWYNLPLSYQKQLCLVIVRAQKHCCVTALTFQTLSIRTLTTVFNTATSYFTLLRQVQES